MKKVLLISLYWFLQLTWGIVLTSIGFIALIISLILGGKPHKNGCSIIVEIGGNWGGLNLGAFSFCGNYSKSNKLWYNHTRKHEFGHSIQNIIFGPFQLFIVAIPSAIRYWYLEYKYKKYGSLNIDYDNIWFEKTATRLGKKFIK